MFGVLCCIDGLHDGAMYVWTPVAVGWVDGRMDGWMGGWLPVWMV